MPGVIRNNRKTKSSDTKSIILISLPMALPPIAPLDKPDRKAKNKSIKTKNS